MISMPDCIIAAGGLSSRMKNRWKPSLSWGGISMIEKVAGEALEAGCRVIIAGGYRFSSLRDLFSENTRSERLFFHYSEGWEKGMDATVRSVLRDTTAAYTLSESFFIVPADMPFIRADDYKRLAALQREKKMPVIRPVVSGKPGHPVLLGSQAAGTLLGAVPGTPIREIISALDTWLEPWGHEGVIRDIDTPDLYEKYKPLS